MLRHRPLLLAISAITCAGCAVAGDPVAAPESASPTSQTPAIRQTDDAGRRLPFDTKFPDRWSSNNDGTPYEPCTSVTESILTQFKLDPQSAEDVAIANHQTVRGCRWRFTSDNANSVAQIAANAPTLDEYRSKNEGIFIFFPDTAIEGRQVQLFKIDDSTPECSAAVRSSNATVDTTVTLYRNARPIDQICDMAVDFLRKAIDKIPR